MTKESLSHSSQRLASALLEIDAVLERAQAAKNQIESDINYGGPVSGGGCEFPEEALAVALEEANARLTILLDVMGLDGAQQQLAMRWATFEKNPKGLGDTKFYPDVDWLESKPLDYLRNLLNGLRIFTDPSDSIRDADQLKLEQLLRGTAVLVRRRQLNPQSEREIQNVMHDYLGVYFPTYTTQPHVHGALKKFESDGGVSSLKAAIEFKFACSEAEVLTALDGFFEDVSGYSGSDDWKTFYAVVYQTEPFVSESKFRSEFDRTGAKHWFPILVNGKGRRRQHTSSKKSAVRKTR
jgi:hypothetical protein